MVSGLVASALIAEPYCWPHITSLDLGMQDTLIVGSVLMTGKVSYTY